jgi:hypothetical protein
MELGETVGGGRKKREIERGRIWLKCIVFMGL